MFCTKHIDHTGLLHYVAYTLAFKQNTTFTINYTAIKSEKATSISTKSFLTSQSLTTLHLQVYEMLP